jgi:hypothetical protein
MKTNLSVAGFGVLFGVFILFLTPGHAGGDGYAAIGDIQSSAFFPLVLAILLIIVSAGFFIVTLVGAGQAAAVVDHGPARPEGEPVEAPLRLAATAASLVLYYVLIGWIGMVPASVVLILGLSWVLGFRNYWVAVCVAVAVPFGVELLFQKMLYVMLPEGRLF